MITSTFLSFAMECPGIFMIAKELGNWTAAKSSSTLELLKNLLFGRSQESSLFPEHTWVTSKDFLLSS